MMIVCRPRYQTSSEPDLGLGNVVGACLVVDGVMQDVVVCGRGIAAAAAVAVVCHAVEQDLRRELGNKSEWSCCDAE